MREAMREAMRETMLDAVLELVLRPLAAAFMEVGVYVALLVAVFGWARHRWGARFDAALEDHRRLGPLIAAFMTVPPGCGGAIVVMSLYARGAVSYGAAVAALVATMGDACWVLLAAEPLLTAQLKVLLVTVGALTGYLVDALRIAPARRAVTPAEPPRDRVVALASPPPATAVNPISEWPLAGDQPRHRTVSSRPVPERSASGQLDALPRTLWICLGAGLALSLPVTFQLHDPMLLGRALLGGVDPKLVIGAGGTALCLAVLARRGAASRDGRTAAPPSSMAEVLRRGGDEVAFVTIWVAGAYLTWSLVTHATGFDGSQLPLLGLTGVLVGALVGLIPGCAIQIVFVGIFLAGGMPLSTLVANTMSQDGDALIPLLALEHRSALLATVITTLPALVVGAALLWLS